MTQPVTAAPRGAAADRAAAVTRAIDVMRANLARDHPVGALARVGAFSASHFHRAFREVTTVAPARFLAALRMAEARRLLMHSDLTVAEIGARVGYGSLGTFCTRFAWLVGAAPGHFRRLARAVGGTTVGALWAALRVEAGVPHTAAGPWIVLPERATRDAVLLAAARPAGPPDRHADPPVPACHLPTVPADRMAEGTGYRVYAVVAEPSASLADVFVDAAPGSYLFGSAPFRPGAEPASVSLHPPGPTDLPILTVAPLLWLAGRAEDNPHAHARSAALS